MLHRLNLQLVFDMLVLQKHNTEMAAGEAFYTLVCLHQVSKQHRAPVSSTMLRWFFLTVHFVKSVGDTFPSSDFALYLNFKESVQR